jgi:NitT/TauT family transport system permease protein
MAWGVIWYGISHLSADIQRCQIAWQAQAKNLQWSHRQQFVQIYVPALAPGFFLIAKNGWSMMWRTLIAIEILFGAMSGSYGLGSFMNETRQQLLAEETWSIMIVILIFGIAVNKIFDILRQRIDWI